MLTGNAPLAHTSAISTKEIHRRTCCCFAANRSIHFWRHRPRMLPSPRAWNLSPQYLSACSLTKAAAPALGHSRTKSACENRTEVQARPRRNKPENRSPLRSCSPLLSKCSSTQSGAGIGTKASRDPPGRRCPMACTRRNRRANAACGENLRRSQADPVFVPKPAPRAVSKKRHHLGRACNIHTALPRVVAAEARSVPSVRGSAYPPRWGSLPGSRDPHHV
jgi:hypothetical protein